MTKMRGMASEFRGHVDEMVRQSELDDVKKQITAVTSGIDLNELDPTKQIKSHLEEGMAEGEKALAEAKSTFDEAPAQPVADPLAEPDSAPQIAVEAPETAADPAPVVAEALPAASEIPLPIDPPAEEGKPEKAAAAS
jgi:sec-independent protein translocase protein TatB